VFEFSSPGEVDACTQKHLAVAKTSRKLGIIDLYYTLDLKIQRSNYKS